MLSTRPDIVAPDIATALTTLQDNVPPFSSEQAISEIERAFKQPCLDVFATFDTMPLASASVAQVHSATLHSGEQVVAKIIRPGIKKTILAIFD